MNAKLLTLVLTLFCAGCATTQQVPPSRAPELRADPEVMEPIKPNFLCLTENLLFGSPAEQTRLRDALREGRKPWEIACEPIGS